MWLVMENASKSMLEKNASRDRESAAVAFWYRNALKIGEASKPAIRYVASTRVLFQPKKTMIANAISAEARKRADISGLLTSSAKQSSTRKTANHGRFPAVREASSPTTEPIKTRGLRNEESSNENVLPTWTETLSRNPSRLVSRLGP